MGGYTGKASSLCVGAATFEGFLGSDPRFLIPRTVDPKQQNDSTLEELFDAIGPLVTPATLCLGEPVTTDKHYVTFKYKKKCFHYGLCKICPIVSPKIDGFII